MLLSKAAPLLKADDDFSWWTAQLEAHMTLNKELRPLRLSKGMKLCEPDDETLAQVEGCEMLEAILYATLV
eukprot:6951659-Pyramimonas_sp.AAC.1